MGRKVAPSHLLAGNLGSQFNGRAAGRELCRFGSPNRNQPNKRAAAD
jgi:hypothetical protein